MATNPFKTAEFKTLFAEWNTVLIETGHKEIEDFSLNEPLLIEWDNLKFRNIPSEILADRRSYYEKARGMVYTYEFTNELHRRIWELHADGISIRAIALQINLKRYKKSTVAKILRKIRKDMR